jgi:hypothetical protein
MDLKAIFGKFVKGAISGGIAGITTLQATAAPVAEWPKAILSAALSAGIHAGWEAYKQFKVA